MILTSIYPLKKQEGSSIFFLEDSLGHLKIAKEALGSHDKYMDYPIRKKSYFSGGGGLSSTIYDYAIFLQMLLNGGTYNGQQILSRNSVRMMTMNQIGDVNFGNNKFGLGFGITTEKGSSILPTPEGVFEWGGAFSTTYWADPKEHLIVLFMTQQTPNSHGDLEQKFEQILYGSLQ